MTKPATEARLASAAKGFTQVVGRGNAHIITKNPTTGKCAYDGQVGGGWHYGAGLETDTAWVAGVAPWKYQMVKANYNLFALSQLNQGQVIKWLDPASGQSVTFQPMALQWTNSLNQIQQISMPQSVAAQVSDDVLLWQNGYGPNRHFRYQAETDRLTKQLIIDSAADLPATTYGILELSFIMSMSSGVTPYIDSGNGLAAWDKKTQMDTVKAIEFRLSSGVVVWAFAVPTAYDSLMGSTTGTMRLKKQGNSLYVSIRFSKSWIDSIPEDNYPIILDPTVEYQISATANDVLWKQAGNFYATNAVLAFGTDAAGQGYRVGVRWPSVTIPDGATIDIAYCSFYHYGKDGTPPACAMYFEDAANPSAISSAADGNSRTKTTATVNVTHPTSGTWWNTPSVVSIVTELLESNSYAAGAAMQLIVEGPDGTANQYGSSWDRSGSSYAGKLHIEYTEAAGGAVIPVFMNQYMRRR